jgi:hypothetical protein
MHDSQRYRDNAAKCLLAAQEACPPYYRKLRLSMAISWPSLARQDEAMDNRLANWDTALPVKRGWGLLPDSQTFVSRNGHRDEKAVRRRFRTASSFSGSSTRNTASVALFRRYRPRLRDFPDLGIDQQPARPGGPRPPQRPSVFRYAMRASI